MDHDSGGCFHICEYTLACVAMLPADFITQCKVLGDPGMKSHALLMTTYAMHRCFDLLGIRHVTRI
jgi:hypothetical protein